MFKLIVLATLAAFACAQEETTTTKPSIGTTDGDLNVNIPQDKHAVFKRSVTESVSLFDVVSDVKALKESFEAEVAARQAASAQASQTIGALNSAVELITTTANQYSRLDDVVAAQAKSATDLFKALGDQTKGTTAAISAVSSSLTKEIAGNQAAIEQLSKTVASEVATEISDLRSAMDTLKTELTSQTTAAIKKVTDDTNAAIAKMKSDSNKAISSGLAPLSKISECSQKGTMYDQSANTCRPTVWERWWNNNWGAENGYVPNRRITITKWRDDTDLKITYFDNMRVHGHHWCRAAWYVEIDRNECTDPGRISYDKYSHQQHNYWMNDHIGGSAHGVCRSTKRGRIGKGKHTLEVRLYTQRCDTYTGHNSQGGYFIIEEVTSTKVTS